MANEGNSGHTSRVYSKVVWSGYKMLKGHYIVEKSASTLFLEITEP